MILGKQLFPQICFIRQWWARLQGARVREREREGESLLANGKPFTAFGQLSNQSWPKTLEIGPAREAYGRDHLVEHVKWKCVIVVGVVAIVISRECAPKWAPSLSLAFVVQLERELATEVVLVSFSLANICNICAPTLWAVGQLWAEPLSS